MQPIYIVKKTTCMHSFQLTSLPFGKSLTYFLTKKRLQLYYASEACKSPWGGTVTRTYCSWIQREHTYSSIVWGKEYRVYDFYKSYKVNRLYKAMSLEKHSIPASHSVEDSRVVLCCDMAVKIIQQHCNMALRKKKQNTLLALKIVQQIYSSK